MPSPCSFCRESMDGVMVLKYAVLLASAAVIGAGVLVLAGVLVPRNVPEEWRVLSGVVLVLYGLYRFVIAYVRQPKR